MSSNNNNNNNNIVTSSGNNNRGKAGNTNYDEWNKITNELIDEIDKEDEMDIMESKKQLGLDGKYAYSEDDAKERKKANEILKVKEAIENYQNREKKMIQQFTNLFSDKDNNDNSNNNTVVRITRAQLDAGKRVIVIADTNVAGSNKSNDDDDDDKNNIIVLTQDLSLIESKISNGNSINMKPKQYKDDAENQLAVQPQQQQGTVYGIIKAFFNNVHNCTIIIKCKILTGTIELNHCSNVTIQVQKYSTVATIQADLCQNITVQFYDAPSGKSSSSNRNHNNNNTSLYWGDDKDDRIYHAGVRNLRVQIYRDDVKQDEIVSDYLNDGAISIGNASPEEYQFVTSVVNNRLITERVLRKGSSTGRNVRAMTQRELDEENQLREKVSDIALKKAEQMFTIQSKNKKDSDNKNNNNGKETMMLDKKNNINNNNKNDQEDVENEKAMNDIVNECEENKKRGNEAFSNGEYGQAILLYTLAIDKSEEIKDFMIRNNNNNDDIPTTEKTKKSSNDYFRVDLCYSNRCACFLKLGQHEKAIQDAVEAQNIVPDNIKAIFRHGLALHAIGKYEDALPILVRAHKLEPKNKQIKQAIQFCEVKLQQQLRQRQT